eukprot:2119939-Karenia_brevis.AAC.1
MSLDFCKTDMCLYGAVDKTDHVPIIAAFSTTTDGSTLSHFYGLGAHGVDFVPKGAALDPDR